MRLLFMLLVLLLGTSGPVFAKPKLVVSIQPLYLLASELAGERVEVVRLIPPRYSPHDYRLRPTQRLLLAEAAAVVWMGPQLETGLASVIENLEGPVRRLAKVEPVAIGQTDHRHGADGHDWLDPQAAIRMVVVLSNLLVELDSAGAEEYRLRAERLSADLTALQLELVQRLLPMRTRGYWVAHDAYSHFEERFGLRHLAAVAVSPERPPGAAHVLALQKQLQAGEVDCVFREPQFNPPILAKLMAGRVVPVIELDPLGVDAVAAPGAFVTFLRQFGQTFAGCARDGLVRGEVRMTW